MKKPYLYGVISVAVILCSFVSFFAYSLFASTVSYDSGVVYYLQPGLSKKSLIAELQLQGLIRHPALFSLYTYPQASAQLKTGEYLFKKGSTPASIWRQVTTGTGLYYRHFTIVPGWSIKQLRQALAQAPGLQHVTLKLDDKKLMTYLGDAKVAPEGQFYPETYYYTRGNLDLVILKRAFDYMQKKLKEGWQNRAKGLPYKTEYEALIAASLVEKEAYLHAERPIIAGVLINRLRKNMLLQFDPTVIYGMGSRYNGKIHKEDLQENTPYNTYIHFGLPPTPIAMPSSASLSAALHPQENDYYYFVARGDGSHQFSKSLTEHNAAVNTLIKHQQSFFNHHKVERYAHHVMVGLLKSAKQDGSRFKAKIK